jgi:hypothetical protein
VYLSSNDASLDITIQNLRIEFGVILEASKMLQGVIVQEESMSKMASLPLEEGGINDLHDNNNYVRVIFYTLRALTMACNKGNISEEPQVKERSMLMASTMSVGPMLF